MENENSVTNKRHAYLIIAHNKFNQLRELLSLIDDYRNDIYVHIDKRANDFTDESPMISSCGFKVGFSLILLYT